MLDRKNDEFVWLFIFDKIKANDVPIEEYHLRRKNKAS